MFLTPPSLFLSLPLPLPASQASAVTTLFLKYYLTHTWDLIAVCGGTLAGFVSITAGAALLEPWAAVLAGFVGAFIHQGGIALLLKLKIDDPLDAR